MSQKFQIDKMDRFIRQYLSWAMFGKFQIDGSVQGCSDCIANAVGLPV